LARLSPFLLGPKVGHQVCNVCNWLGQLSLDMLRKRFWFPEAHCWLRLLIATVYGLRNGTDQIQLF
jgi:hypothetical protein